MSLSENQANHVWEMMFEAEVRSLYFADLAAQFTKRKQWITGISFFLSSGAAASLIGNAPTWIPIALATITAVLTAYSIAVSLDKAAATMVKLHSMWDRLASDCERLWHHWQDEDAERILTELQNRSREASELGTEAPYREDLLDKWHARISEKYSPRSVAA